MVIRPGVDLGVVVHGTFYDGPRGPQEVFGPVLRLLPAIGAVVLRVQGGAGVGLRPGDEVAVYDARAEELWEGQGVR